MSPENQANKRKIAVFFFENGRDINTYPYIVNAAAMLVEKGWRVDVFLNSSMTAAEKIEGVDFIFLSGNTMSSYVFNAVKYIRKNRARYISFFAYTFEGIVVSYLLNRSKSASTPVVYFSLELIYSNFIIKNLARLSLGILGIIPGAAGLKNVNIIFDKLLFYNSNIYYYYVALKAYLDIFVFKNKSFVIASVAQDEKRGELLKKEFDFAGEPHYIPNGYIGCADRDSNFAFRRFGISENKKIILFTGGLFLGADSDELFELSKKLDDDHILFLNIYDDAIHVRSAREKYRGQIENGRLYINRVNLSCAEYDDLVGSSHICLAWYKDTGAKDKNIHFMGLSSGKLAKYLSRAKPVIVPGHVSGYRKMVEDNSIGRAVDSLNDIPEAVKDIEKNYSEIKLNAKKFYIEKYEYSKYFNRFYGAFLKKIFMYYRYKSN